jgi:hypothetical protein
MSAQIAIASGILLILFVLALIGALVFVRYLIHLDSDNNHRYPSSSNITPSAKGGGLIQPLGEKPAQPYNSKVAGIAQQVEQLICNQKVTGSIPVAGTK